MFCPQCGTQVADTAAFCRKCGTSLREDEAQPAAPPPVQAAPPSQPVYQQPAPQPAVATQPRQTMRHTLAAAMAVQPVVGIFAVGGAAVAVIGTMLPWINIAGETGNGFDIGYITDSAGSGNDGLLVLLLGLAAGAVAAHYFWKPYALLSIAGIVLGAAAAAIAGYNFIKVYNDLNDLCNGNCSPFDYIAYGLYMSVIGGAVAAVASFIGFRRESP